MITEAIIALNVMTYTKGNRSVYSLNIHLVLVTKYRRQGLRRVASCGGVTLEYLKQYVEQQAAPRS